MHALSSEQILNVWETARQQHELDRALTLLATAEPNTSRNELAQLPIGERDARLLRLRTLTFGSALSGFDVCPGCGERVEFHLDTIALEQPREALPDVRELRQNGCRVRYRLPTSLDLAEVVTAPDPADGVRRLLSRCIIEKVGAGVLAAGDHENEPSPDLIQALGEAMAEADPQAEVTLALQCPNCARFWQALLDIGAFFWREIEAQAGRIFREIDTLARRYGWSEREILGLPAQRRQTYLEMIDA